MVVTPYLAALRVHSWLYASWWLPVVYWETFNSGVTLSLHTNHSPGPLNYLFDHSNVFFMILVESLGPTLVRFKKKKNQQNSILTELRTLQMIAPLPYVFSQHEMTQPEIVWLYRRCYFAWRAGYCLSQWYFNTNTQLFTLFYSCQNFTLYLTNWSLWTDASWT